MKKVVKYIFLVGLFYYLLKDLNGKKLLEGMEHYSLFWSAIAMVSVVVSDFFLSLRWRFLTGDKISLLASFEAIGISGFLNFILPAKTGELSKIVYLKKFYGFRTSNTTAVLVMERVFDVVILAFVTLATTLFLFQIEGALKYSAAIFTVFTLFLLFLRSNGIKKIIGLLPNQRLRVFVFRTFKLTLTLSNRKILTYNFIYSILVWMSYFFTVYLFLIYVADFHLTLQETFIVFVISSVALSLPLLPGGVGTYQAGVVFALGLYGVGKEEALLSAVFLQVFMLIPSFLIAFYILVKKDITLKSLKFWN